MTPTEPKSPGRDVPPGLWILPGGLRGERPAAGGAARGVMQTLEIQGSLAAFSCMPSGAAKSWKGRARVRIYSALMALALLGSFSITWIWFGNPAVFLLVPAVLLVGPIWRLGRAVFGGLSVEVDGEWVTLKWLDMGRPRSMRQPLSAYAGVARWSGMRLRTIPLFTWSHRWWVVVLVHRDRPECSVPLLLSQRFDTVVEAQQAAAKRFNLPVLLESPHGGAWRPRPVEALDTGLGERLREIWSAQAAKVKLPQEVTYAPGGGVAWSQEINDRWLWILFLIPLGGLLYGMAGLLVGAVPTAFLAAVLWGYWGHGDQWYCDGQTLRLTLMRRFGGAQRVALPVDQVIAARLVPGQRGDGFLEVETRKKVYAVRVGRTPATQVQDSLESLLRCLRGG